MLVEKVKIKTSDGINIAADYYPADSHRGIVLVHMMPATKESWRGLAEKLQSAGFHALAIDLRGHGESGGGDYHSFTPEEHQASVADLVAAAEFLKTKGVSELNFTGASIGANLSLQYLAQNHETKSAIALSAGLDYYGVKAADYVKKLDPKQKILLVGSRDDGRASGNCGEMAEKLFDLANCRKEKIIYDTGGHGTNLFLSHADLQDRLIEFLNSEI
ncbi:MAG: alpha/beta fold hydrolase [bacterium]|nr:alpha/beta fold hydrolase [bacterium]